MHTTHLWLWQQITGLDNPSLPTFPINLKIIPFMETPVCVKWEIFICNFTSFGVYNSGGSFVKGRI